MDSNNEQELLEAGLGLAEGTEIETETLVGSQDNFVDVDSSAMEHLNFSTNNVEGNQEESTVGIIAAPKADSIDLTSDEKLDRSSPDLWPRNLITSASHLLAKKKKAEQKAGTGSDGGSKSPTEAWAQGLDPEDMNLLHQFGSLTSTGLIEEVKKLQNIAHQLGLEEAKEINRGKLLRVLDDWDNGSLNEKENRKWI